MKKKVLLLAMVLVLMLLTPGVLLALPPIPTHVRITEPDPSLPKELTAFLGKWEATGRQPGSMAIIVEKINEEKATLYISDSTSWNRREANVSKEQGKYKIWFHAQRGINEMSLKEDGSLTLSYGGNYPGSLPFKRIP